MRTETLQPRKLAVSDRMREDLCEHFGVKGALIRSDGESTCRVGHDVSAERADWG